MRTKTRELDGQLGSSSNTKFTRTNKKKFDGHVVDLTTPPLRTAGTAPGIDRELALLASDSLIATIKVNIMQWLTEEMPLLTFHLSTSWTASM